MCWSVGQAVKTPPFHGGNTGSSPVRIINFTFITEDYPSPAEGNGLENRQACKSAQGFESLILLIDFKIKIHWSGGVGVNMPACHAGDRGFKSRPDRYIMRV